MKTYKLILIVQSQVETEQKMMQRFDEWIKGIPIEADKKMYGKHDTCLVELIVEEQK